MKALLFGADGQLGRALASGRPEGITLVLAPRSVADLSVAGACAAVIAAERPDWIVNAAAWTGVDQAEADEAAADRVNHLAPLEMAEAARVVGARLVQVSTDHVFDGALGRPYRADDPQAPVNAYGRSKARGERAVARALPDALVVRTAWVHGPTGQNFVRKMLDALRTRERIDVVADQLGAPTSADHLADALWTMVRRGAEGVHHVTDAGAASRYDLAMAIAAEARAAGLVETVPPIRPIRTTDLPPAAPRPFCVLLDCGRTQALIGRAQPHWHEGVRRTLRSIADRG